MKGRIRYYFKKSQIKLKRQGPGALLKHGVAFLYRRKFFLEFLLESLDYFIFSRFRDHHKTIIQILKNEPITEGRVLLYASYDPKSEIKAHVIEQLDAFQKQGYQIIFVSTAEHFLFAEYDKIKAFVSICIHRKNIGYDFGSWKVAYDFIEPRFFILNSLIIMNDSCAGPLFDITDILYEMRETPKTVYGISMSEEISEHIQSYFYHFGGDLVNTPLLRQFFSRIRMLKTKWGVVRFLEIGSSRFLKKQGIFLKALIDPKDPAIKERMDEAGLTEPTREPLASEWVKHKLSPFYKRSNLNN